MTTKYNLELCNNSYGLRAIQNICFLVSGRVFILNVAKVQHGFFTFKFTDLGG